jgi:hypothetical protein
MGYGKSGVRPSVRLSGSSNTGPNKQCATVSYRPAVSRVAAMNDINMEVLLQQLLQSDPGLFDCLTLGQVIRFVALASQVKNRVFQSSPIRPATLAATRPQS